MNEPRVIALPASLDAAAAEALQAVLVEARGAPLVLSASEVERVGGLGLQILLSARATWAQDGLSFAVADASERFDEHLALLGAPDLTFEPEGNVR